MISLCRKSFQSLEQLSADMSLSQTSLERSNTLSLEARPAGTHWPRQGTSPPTHCCPPLTQVLTPVYCVFQVKRKLHLSEVYVAPWPQSPATNLWPAWSPVSVWPVPPQRSAVQASPLHRERRAGWHVTSRARQSRNLPSIGDINLLFVEVYILYLEPRAFNRWTSGLQAENLE